VHLNCKAEHQAGNKSRKIAVAIGLQAKKRVEKINNKTSSALLPLAEERADRRSDVG